jgi:HEAT repeat protein
MEFAETFEESVEIAQTYLSEVNAPLILIGVTDDTELRQHFVAELRDRLADSVDLREFHYDPRNISLLEGALAIAATNGEKANGHRIAVSAIGLEALPRDKQSEAIKLLNAQRNRLGYARLAVILWLNHQLFAEVANKSYDFYSWRSHTLFLEPPSDWNEMQRLESLRRSYLQAVVYQNEYVNLQGLAPMRGGQIVQMRMDEIFIPLQVEQEIILPRGETGSDEIERWGEVEQLGEKGIDESLPMQQMPLSPLNRLIQRFGRTNRETVTRRAEMPELFRQRRAVVIGDPGAGKTTLLRYLAHRLAQSQLSGGQIDSGWVGMPALPGEIADCLPVYLRLGLYARHLKENPGTTMVDFAPHQNFQLPLPAELLKHATQRGKTLFLLDGLDEIVDASQRREVVRRVEEFARQFAHCPMIVTSRIVGYRESPLGAEFVRFTVRPFDDEEIVRFVRQWYRRLGQPERADDLLEGIEKNPSVRRLATNPLLLTVTALIHLRNTRLPSRRVELYQKAAETLADNWMSERRVTPDDWDVDEALNKLLPAIAWRLHIEASGGLMNQDELHQLLVETLRANNPRLSEQEAHNSAAQFRRNVSEFSGIFLERGLDEAGRGLYGFLHLTFEEYFASVKLRDKWKREGSQVLKPLLHDPRWTEVILLCAGGMDQFDATRLVETILGADSEYEDVLHRDLLLAARVLANDVRVDPEMRREIVRRLAELYFSPQSPWALQKDIRQTFAELAGTQANDDAVEVLESCLTDSDEQVRESAVLALGDMGEHAASQQVVEKLYALLSDSVQDVRKAALEALLEMGERAANEHVLEKLLKMFINGLGFVLLKHFPQQMIPLMVGKIFRHAASDVVEKLMALLTDSDWRMRCAAIETLSKMDKAALTDQVIEKVCDLFDDSEGSVRAAAARALGEMGEYVASDRVIEKLCELLADSEGSVRAAAARALGEMGERAANDQVIERLSALLTDSDWGAQNAAAEVLEKMGERASSGSVNEKVASLLADRKDRNSNWDPRDIAAALLAERRERVEKLLAILTDGDVDAQNAAAEAMEKMGGHVASERVVEKLLALIEGGDWMAQDAAVGMLGKIREEAVGGRVIERLYDLLGNEKPSVRVTAAELLSGMGERAASDKIAERLLRLLTDSEWSVQEAAATALSKMGEQVAREQVIEELLTLIAERDWNVQCAAGNVLGSLGKRAASERVVKQLQALLGDKNPYTRIAAARVLIMTGDQAAGEPVVETLLDLLTNSEEDDLRILAVNLMEALGERSATEPVLGKLQGLLASENRQLKIETMSALGNMGDRVASETIIKNIVRLLADKDESIQHKAKHVLENIVKQAMTERPLEMVLDVLASSGWRMRFGFAGFAAQDVLEKIGERASSDPMLDKLLTRIISNNKLKGFVRVRMVKNIGEMAAGEPVIEKLLILLSYRNKRIQAAAVEGLRKMGERAANERVVKQLVALLAGNGWLEECKRWAVTRLEKRADGKGTSGEIAKGISDLLENPISREQDVRNEVRWALNELTSKVSPSSRSGVIKLVLPLAYKKGRTEKIRDQRNTGYIALRNLMAAGVE